MTGQVEVMASLTPDRLFFANMLKGSTDSKTVELTGKIADKIKLDKIVSSKPEELKAELLNEDGKQKIKVTLIAPAKEGRFSARLTAQTGVEEPKELTLMVSAQITGDLVTDKSFAQFGQWDEKSKPNFSLTLKSLGGKPFQVKKVVDAAGIVEGAAKKVEQGWKIDLTLTKNPPTQRGIVQVHTDRADQPIVSVNYSVRQARGAPPGIRGKLQHKGMPIKGKLTPFKGGRVPQSATQMGGKIRLAPKPVVRDKPQLIKRPLPGASSSGPTSPKSP